MPAIASLGCSVKKYLPSFIVNRNYGYRARLTMISKKNHALLKANSLVDPTDIAHW